MTKMNSLLRRPERFQRFSQSLGWLVFLGAIVLTGGFLVANQDSLTFRGVPVSIILEFIEDESARQAYFAGNKVALHERLQQLGAEEQIKAFYRPKIRDEVKLDQYIHQIFYEVSGYVGKAYRVDSRGVLVLKQAPSNDFEQWVQLAEKAGVITGTKEENGVKYVISPAGDLAPYNDIAAIFPVEDLQRLIEAQGHTSR
jgi:hypothetical protein